MSKAMIAITTRSSTSVKAETGARREPTKESLYELAEQLATLRCHETYSATQAVQIFACSKGGRVVTIMGSEGACYGEPVESDVCSGDIGPSKSV